MSRQWEAFAAGACAAWLDLQAGGAAHLCAGGSLSWLSGYRALLNRPPRERAAFLVALAGASGPGRSRRG